MPSTSRCYNRKLCMIMHTAGKATNSAFMNEEATLVRWFFSLKIPFPPLLAERLGGKFRHGSFVAPKKAKESF